VTARALVVEHLATEGAGAFADWLPAAGLDLDTHRVHLDGPPPTTLPAGYAALIVMGGSMGVPDADTTHPWLHDDMALIRDAVARGVPTLGVCLGAQLLAAACGGAVRKGRIGPELGLCRVHLTGAAATDHLLADLPPILDVVQWHWDEVLALPPGAVHLAASPAYPHQAFRVGETAWGLQFHPEARPSMVRRWAEADSADVRAAGEDPTALAERAAAAWPDNERTWLPVLVRFAAVVQDVAHRASNESAGTSVGGL
jgi:GMP synthase-like glutamine amidotransferase